MTMLNVNLNLYYSKNLDEIIISYYIDIFYIQIGWFRIITRIQNIYRMNIKMKNNYIYNYNYLEWNTKFIKESSKNNE